MKRAYPRRPAPAATTVSGMLADPRLWPPILIATLGVAANLAQIIQVIG